MVCMINATWSDNWCHDDLIIHNDTWAKKAVQIGDRIASPNYSMILNMSEILGDTMETHVDDGVLVCKAKDGEDYDYQVE